MKLGSLEGKPWWHPKTILYCILVVLKAIFKVITLILTLWPSDPQDITPTTAGYSDKDQKRRQKKKKPSA